MQSVISIWFDFVAAMGLILALASVYARFRRLSSLPVLGQFALGLCFGLVALWEMNHSLEPYEGLIIDMRNIPIALAGAFLSPPAALFTVVIGLVSRAMIGGVGMWAGMAAMLIAVAAGWFWQRWYAMADRRTLWSFLVLGLLMSGHIAAAVVLPDGLAMWFLTNAAVPLFALNMVTVPVFAALLNAEQRDFLREKRLRDAAVIDHDSGLMSLETMHRECVIRATALSDGSFTHALCLRVRPTHLLYLSSLPVVQKRLLASVRLRLQASLPNCDLAGLCDSKILVVPLPQSQLVDLEQTKIDVLRAVSEDPYAFAGSGAYRISVDVDFIALPEAAGDIEYLCKQKFGLLRLCVRPRVDNEQAEAVQKFVLNRPLHVNDARLENLFAKADVLMRNRYS